MQEKNDEIKEDKDEKMDEDDNSEKIIQEIQIEELTIDGICGVY